jgi:Domain of unknown function (DUF4091)
MVFVSFPPLFRQFAMLPRLPHSLLGIALFLCMGDVVDAADAPKEIDRLPAAERGRLQKDQAFARREPIVVPPPKGTPIRLPVTRDTWFCSDGEQANGNNGGSDRLKLKSYQEMALVDFDPAPLNGRVVKGAYLHLHLASPADPLRRVTVSSFAAPWVEGTATGYAPQKGSSSFNSRQHPNISWTTDDNRIAEGEPNDLTAVMVGSGGTLWRMADATPPDADGWQQVPIDPAVVAARVAGLSEGFLLFDDTGSEWARDGERFTPHPFPNRYVHSRESGAKTAPYFTIYRGGEDHEPPGAPAHLAVDAERTATLPPGEAWLTWETPADRGPAGTLGFLVTIAGRNVPRYLIPMAGRVGQPVEMHLRDLWFEPGRDVEVAVRAVDGAGNVGNAAKQTIKLSGFVPQRLPLEFLAPLRKMIVPETRESRPRLPRLDGAQVAIVDELDKARAASGELSPLRARTYLLRNHLWDNHSIQLYVARNEVVGFQVLFRGPITDLVPELKFTEGASSPRVSFSQVRFVPAEGALVADPVLPLNGKFTVPSPGAKPQDEKCGSILCELYIPHDAANGDITSTLELRTPRDKLSIPLELHVWNFTLPDQLSFIPEMNCYGVAGDERAYYRLAHDHRTVLNVVPYHQNGAVEEGWAPKWDGHCCNWTAWDRRFGPLFDGTAFADSRRRTPQECFYLPLNENWPTPIEGNYNGDYWADRAFPQSYRNAFREASRQMAEHFNARGWNDTLFQCFFNGKNNYKSAGWSRGSSPWSLDEPASFQDFWALRYFGAAFHEGINRASGMAKLLFRCDISRPEWQRDSLDGLLDYNVVAGGALRQYERLVMDRKERERQIVIEYGNSNAIEESNVQPVAWSIDAWSRGVDGVLPWLAVGSEAAWNKAEQTSLIYPPRPGHPEPAPSLRLKAFRRGQQDVEYLTLWSQVTGQPRWAIGPQVREALHLSPRKSGTGFIGDEDAGILRYDQLKPEDLFALRVRLGAALDKLHPAPRRQLVEVRTPPRDPDRLPPRLVGE